MIFEETFEQNVQRWKKTFIDAVAISPLLLILYPGSGEHISISLTLQVGGRLASYGKPELLQRIEEMLWHCIIGVAWGCWTSDTGLTNFLTEAAPLIRGDSEGADTWFSDAFAALVQCNQILGLEEVQDRALLDGWHKCCINASVSLSVAPTVESALVYHLDFDLAINNPVHTLERFHDHNILVVGATTSQITWMLSSLSKIGNPDANRDFQDHQGQGRDMRLSLHELHEESQENEGLILSVLHLPCRTQDLHPLQLIFSSDMGVFKQTSVNTERIFQTEGYPASATHFWYVATKSAIDRIKPYCLGVCTVIQVHCGHQLWYLFQRRVKKRDKLIHAYHDWDFDFVNDPKQWKAEVVVLEPGNVLFIQPGTLHAVVTLENSIVRGQHFYTTTTLSKTISGRVDTYIHGVKIERVLYFQLRDLLFRLILYLEDGLNTDSIENDSSKFKVNTAEGLLDIVALGNLLLSLPALDIVAIFDAHKPDAYGPRSEGRQAYFDIIYRLQEQYSLILFPDTPLAHDAFTKPLDSLVSLRIADFAKTSAIHFAWSLILSARKAQGWRKVYLKAFKQSVERTLDFFFACTGTLGDCKYVSIDHSILGPLSSSGQGPVHLMNGQ
ncbi:uncharacterized protein EV420DRAFT_1641633 [Desarmillaria tabescens]|uniref:JmjC domain-containing protein n=1 Tax=Armillaria tabescens TaxID=1929756 RepID=A0AA39KJ17_ARMTA|nr:uncharacterized protein EV420DRAFT_1641633 [Desarmillaria tabescens]KAK0460288.1 hypothetical protein EV420DRAFT_1641633 [Desarmillaria tabescens]